MVRALSPYLDRTFFFLFVLFVIHAFPPRVDGKEKFMSLEYEPAIDRTRAAQLIQPRVVLSDTTYSLIGFRKSTPPQNRQPYILISNS